MFRKDKLTVHHIITVIANICNFVSFALSHSCVYASAIHRI